MILWKSTMYSLGCNIPDVSLTNGLNDVTWPDSLGFYLHSDAESCQTEAVAHNAHNREVILVMLICCK